MKFFAVFLLCALATFCIYPLTNVCLDKYGLFQTPVNGCVRVFNEPNKNFLKARFIRNNPEAFDSFLFGSSRAGKIDVQRIPDGRYYNMSYSEGLPGEHLENIKLFLRSGVKIRNIAIGLDDFSFQMDPAEHSNQPMRLAHYGTRYNPRSWLAHYWYYLFLKIRLVDFRQSLEKEGIELFLTGASRSSDEYEANIDKDLETYVHLPKFSVPHSYKGDRSEETIAEIREIVEIARENGVHLKVFINPVHHVTYLDKDFEAFLNFKKMLAEVTDFYDFSGLNSITMDNANFYETSHYRQKIGDLLVEHLFLGREPAQDGFGRLVTKENFPAHAELMRSQLRPKNAGKSQKMPSAVSYSILL